MNSFASGQKIVVDTASTSKYLINRDQPGNTVKESTPDEEISFSDRALSIGNGILNRLKARLNLEEAAESIKAKGEKIVGKDTQQTKDGGKDDGT